MVWHIAMGSFCGCCGCPAKAQRSRHCCVPPPTPLYSHFLSLSFSSIIIINTIYPPHQCIHQQRKKGFKKSIDVDEGRRRREETTLQIRKTAKDVRLAKRRQMPGSDGGMGGGGGYSNMNTPAALAAASMLAAGGVAPGGYGEMI
jgi:hypothetical protein